MDISSTEGKNNNIEIIPHLSLTTDVKATQETLVANKQSVMNGSMFKSANFADKKFDNLKEKAGGNLSFILYGDIDDSLNLVWNTSEKKSLKSANTSVEQMDDENDTNKEVFMTVLITGVIALLLIISVALSFAILYSRSCCSFRFLLRNQKIIRRL